jgi:hypothetical protein
MLNIRLVLFLIFLVLIQAEANNYIRGEKLNPASRIVSGTSNNNGSEPTVEKNNEFQAVKRRSKPVQGASPGRNQRPQW